MAIKSAISGISKIAGSAASDNANSRIGDVGNGDQGTVIKRFGNDVTLDHGSDGDGKGTTNGKDNSDGKGGDGQVDDNTNGKKGENDGADSPIKTTTDANEAALNRLLAQQARGAGAGGAAGAIGAGLGLANGILSSLFGNRGGGGSGGGGYGGGGAQGSHGQSSQANIAGRSQAQYDSGFANEQELHNDASKFLSAFNREDSNSNFTKNLESVSNNQDHKLHGSMLRLKSAAEQLLDGQENQSLESLRQNSPEAYSQFMDAYKETSSLLNAHGYREGDRSPTTPADLLTNESSTFIKVNNVREDEGSMLDGIDFSMSSQDIGSELTETNLDIGFGEATSEANDMEAADEDQAVDEEPEVTIEAEDIDEE